jgi:hypothetical protein
MPNPKVKIYGDSEKPGTIYRYSGLDSLCKEYSKTPWCNGKVKDFLVDMMVRFPKPLYVLQDVGKEGELKEWLIYQNPSGTNIIDSDGEDSTIEKIIDEIGFLKPIDYVLVPLVQRGSDFKDIVKRFLYGKAMTDELETLPRVVSVDLRRSGNTFGSSKIRFKLPKQKLLDNLGLNEYDEWELVRCLGRNSYYVDTGREYVDDYMVKEALSDGHWYLRFYSDENRERLGKIVKIVLPNEQIPDNLLEVNDKVMAKFWAYLDNVNLSEYTEPLIDIIVYEINQQIGDSICESITSEWKDFLNKTNASYYDWYDEELVYEVSNLYVTLMLDPQKFINPKNFVDTFGEDYTNTFSDWGENPFEFEDATKVDTLSIDREMDKFLDNIEEEIGTVDWDEYEKIVNQIKKMGFKLQHMTKFEPDSKYDILWTGVDPKTLKVMFKISKGLQQSSFSLPFEKFVSLFTNKKIFSFDTLFGF